ncbi:RloB family protein [Rickettsiales bacterium]|nr:RloB family protein [Rickettsiales bacterium]
MLLFCDGATEIKYFKILKKVLDIKSNLLCISDTPIKNIENYRIKANKIKDNPRIYEDFLEIHFICDIEDMHKNHHNKARITNFEKEIFEINKYLNKIKQDLQIKIIDSFPSFEFWLLLHFPKIKDKDFNKLYSNNEIKKKLEKVMSCKYKKADESWLKKLLSSNKEEVKDIMIRAIQRAKKTKKEEEFFNQSYTMVFETVRQALINSS